LSIESFLQTKLLECKELPILDLKELDPKFPDQELVKRALNLLSLWGKCVYFNHPPELSTTIVLDPKFLTKKVLAELFNPKNQSFNRQGIIPHSKLILIWKSFKGFDNFEDLAKRLLALLQKFEVCFLLSEDEGKPFLEQRSIIPSSLDERAPKEFGDYFGKDVPFGQIQVEKYIFFDIAPKELVGRLFVRLHVGMGEKMIWRSGMYFEKEQNGERCKAHINVDLETARLYLAVRGKDRHYVMSIMEEMTSHVNTSAKVYSGISFTQKVRHAAAHNDCFINLKDCLKHFEDPKSIHVICPVTRDEIDTRKALIDSGILDETEDEKTAKENSWWNFTPDSGWMTKGHQNQFQYLEIFRKDEVYHEAMMGKLISYIGESHVNYLVRAYAIQNDNLSNAFTIFMNSLGGKIKAAKKLFQADDWKNHSDSALKTKYLQHYGEWVGSFPWNKKGKLEVLGALQGTTEEAAWSIAENGFGTVSVLDEGFFGKGMYFTSNFEYASLYAALKQKSNPSKNKVFVVALVIPGNPFPVTEHPYVNGKPNEKGYLGKGVRSGYQSHFTQVNRKMIGAAYPITGQFDPNEHGNELVVFQEAQILPVFILECK